MADSYVIAKHGTGNVGVGQVPGAEKLEVAGNFKLTGKITAAVAVPASFADLAAVRTYLASILT